MDTLAENLKKLIWENDLNEAELARRTGISQPVINRITKGTTSNPNVDTLRPLAKYFSVTLDQLLGDQPLPSNLSMRALSRGKHVPLISWDEAANWSSLANGYTPKRTYYVAGDCADDTFGLVVRDVTMSPMFAEGSIIIVEPGYQPRNRDFVVVQIGHKTPIFKQLLFDGSEIYLKSLNTDFPLIKVTEPYVPLGIVIENHSEFRHSRPQD